MRFRPSAFARRDNPALVSVPNGDTLMKYMGGIGAAIMALLLLSVLISVAMRTLFSAGSVILEDIILYAYGVLIPFAVLYAGLADRHIRARGETHDMSSLYARFEHSFAAVVFATLFFLTLPGALQAWNTLEGSREIGGLPGFFLIKAGVPTVFLILAFNAARIRIKHRS